MNILTKQITNVFKYMVREFIHPTYNGFQVYGVKPTDSGDYNTELEIFHEGGSFKVIVEPENFVREDNKIKIWKRDDWNPVVLELDASEEQFEYLKGY